jgi:gamma-glutamylcyclotransferase (GGCT)/AIG2-like uncharacterized protein YtfP
MDLNINSEHRLRAENLSWDIDVWYPILADYTFKSIFIPLTVKERDAIIRFNDISWKNISNDNKLTNYEVEILNDLESDIDKYIKSKFSNGAFIRLCGRSPKDGEPLNTNIVYSQYEKIHSNLIKSGWENNIHSKMTAIAKTPYMKVTSGKEAMSLILTSERVYADMRDWKLFGEPEQICLREYNDCITLDFEFRAFVYDDKLTAITQYDHHSYFPHISEYKDVVCDKIKDKISEIHHVIKIKNYVADFAFINNNVLLIELSPFFPCTGSSLFNWHNDLDLLKGKYLPEVIFRLKAKEDVHPQLADLVEINWDIRWNTNQKAYYEWYNDSIVIEKENRKQIYHNLFVYGTLKKDFQWNQKYMSERVGGKYIGEAISVEIFPLFVGDSGVPYLVNTKDVGFNIKGELWEVSELCLKGLDEYEGIEKAYYSREKIKIIVNEKIIEAFVYVLNYQIIDLSNFNLIEEYTLSIHKQQYNPISHIQVKQLNYFKTPSNWGKLETKEVDIKICNPST